MPIIKQVQETLRSVLSLPKGGDELTNDTRLLGSIPELDSMTIVSIITALEDRFNIAIEDDEIDAAVFETVGSLVAFVEHKLA